MKHCRDAPGHTNPEATTGSPDQPHGCSLQGKLCSLGEKAFSTNMAIIDYQIKHRRKKNTRVFAIGKIVELLMLLFKKCQQRSLLFRRDLLNTLVTNRSETEFFRNLK